MTKLQTSPQYKRALAELYKFKRFTFKHLDKTAYVTVTARSKDEAWIIFTSRFPLSFEEYSLMQS